MRSLMWFRRDLRLDDNKALLQAVKDSDSLLAVAFLTPEQWRQHHESTGKIAFWKACLGEVARQLADSGVELKIVTLSSFSDIPARLAEIAGQNKCQTVYFNCEYEQNELRRDEDCLKALNVKGVKVKTFHDRILIEPGRVLTGSGGYYTVFTPFLRSWLGVAQLSDLRPHAAPDKKFGPPLVPDLSALSSVDQPGWRSDLWPAGEAAAHKRLKKFMEHGLVHYHQQRDLPAIDGTSMLSPWLSAGVISPRHCLSALLQVNSNAMKALDSGAGTWLNELVWRDFYNHVLSGFPRVSRSLPFKINTAGLPWRYDEKQLNAWKSGQTGYPIVDAAMRQLNQTGWMHNRLRMVAAMFLSKHLFIHWREGEKYFMETLLDGDLAANNGGWQWSASTGTDAVPYFRIFNPFSQSSRFDSEGVFIRKFCPELADLPTAALHDFKKISEAVARGKIAYPLPIVDHQQARARVLAAFKAGSVI